MAKKQILIKKKNNKNQIKPDVNKKPDLNQINPFFLFFKRKQFLSNPG